MTIGKRIKLQREYKDLSVRELAELSNMTSSTIYRIEQGLHNPRIENVENLARALKLRSGYLAFGE